MTATASVSNPCHFQIRFRPLLLQGRSVAFPCDDHGNVDMDRLSEAGRREYLGENHDPTRPPEPRSRPVVGERTGCWLSCA